MFHMYRRSAASASPSAERTYDANRGGDRADRIQGRGAAIIDSRGAWTVSFEGRGIFEV